METYLAYVVFAVLLGVAFWFVFAWHDVKMQRDDAWGRLAYLKADAETADWYAKRALAAEARLKEWEAAASNNDPYVTNGGYVEVEVLEAVKRRNSELLTRAEAAEARVKELEIQPFETSSCATLNTAEDILRYDRRTHDR